MPTPAYTQKLPGTGSGCDTLSSALPSCSRTQTRTLLKLFNALDTFRRPERFELFILACEADSRGRTGFENAHFDQPDILRRARDAATAVTAKELAGEFTGAAIGVELDRLRKQAIKKAVNR